MNPKQHDIILPISNRSHARAKAFKIYTPFIIIPIFVCFSNPTSFNLYFSAFIVVAPILPLILYLRKNNLKTATLKFSYIEIELNNRKLKIHFSEIEKVTQMIALWVSSEPGFTNVYEVRLKSNREFGKRILLQIKSKTNPTEEHEIITELKHRIKTGGNTSYI